MTRRSAAIGLWLLGTAWICCEAALQALNRNLVLAPGQLDVVVQHAQAVVDALGPHLAGLLLFGLGVYLLQGLLGLVLSVWMAKEAWSFVVRDARRRREELAAAQARGGT